jgi:hypothetical protein
MKTGINEIIGDKSIYNSFQVSSALPLFIRHISFGQSVVHTQYVKIMVFYNVIPYRLVDRYYCFGEPTVPIFTIDKMGAGVPLKHWYLKLQVTLLLPNHGLSKEKKLVNKHMFRVSMPHY